MSGFVDGAEQWLRVSRNHVTQESDRGDSVSRGLEVSVPVRGRNPGDLDKRI